jgi:hypothetical protein
MELVVGLVGVLVGTISGGLSAFLTNRNKMRQELEYAYDRELRIGAWKSTPHCIGARTSILAIT